MEGKAALDNLLGEEQSLIEMANMLKSYLERLNSKMVSKQNEIDWLLAEVAELKLGKRQCNLPNEEGNGESHLGRKLVNVRDIEPDRLAKTLLLEEIWRKIFEKMDGLDLLNASRACQHFHYILDPLKNNFLFGKVLPFLIPHLDLPKIDMLDLPLTTGYIHPFYKIIRSIIQAYSFCKDHFACYCRIVNPFLQQFKSCTRNPFIANSIFIENTPDQKHNDDQLEFREGLDTILDNYGRHIYHLKFYGYGTSILGGSVLLATSELLRKLFSKAQNLQTLVVEEYYRIVGDVDFFEIEDITEAVPHLQSLAIKTQAENPIANWLFRHFHLQITKLHLEKYNGFDAASDFKWPKVTELTISCDNYSMDYLKCFESFPSLQKFGLYLPTCHNYPVLTLPEIFQIILHLPTVCPSFHSFQLSHEYIYCLSPCENEEFHDNAMFAPKELDTLELKMIFPYLSWHNFDFAFLLRFPLIKNLSVVFHPKLDRNREGDSVQDDKMEIMELVKYLEQMSNPSSSNVWRMLPNLETLQLQNKIYKRPKPPTQSVNKWGA